jgi:hypothetical protein
LTPFVRMQYKVRARAAWPPRYIRCESSCTAAFPANPRRNRRSMRGTLHAKNLGLVNETFRMDELRG